MITHILVIKFKEGVDQAVVDDMIGELRAVSRLVDGVESYRVERDARLREGNDDLAILGRFRDETALRTYLAHPDHVAVLKKYVPTLVDTKHSVQFVTED